MSPRSLRRYFGCSSLTSGLPVAFGGTLDDPVTEIPVDRLRLMPRKAHILTLRAEALLMLDDVAAASKEWDQALRLEPDAVRAKLGRVAIARHLGNKETLWPRPARWRKTTRTRIWHGTRSAIYRADVHPDRSCRSAAGPDYRGGSVIRSRRRLGPTFARRRTGAETSRLPEY